jgi:hypothetical protein
MAAPSTSSSKSIKSEKGNAFEGAATADPEVLKAILNRKDIL